jgi:hypothetical protein
VNEEAMARVGPQSHENKQQTTFLSVVFVNLKMNLDIKHSEMTVPQFEPQGNTHRYRQWTCARIHVRETFVWTCTVQFYGK